MTLLTITQTIQMYAFKLICIVLNPLKIVDPILGPDLIHYVLYYERALLEQPNSKV